MVFFIYYISFSIFPDYSYYVLIIHCIEYINACDNCNAMILSIDSARSHTIEALLTTFGTRTHRHAMNELKYYVIPQFFMLMFWLNYCPYVARRFKNLKLDFLI